MAAKDIHISSLQPAETEAQCMAVYHYYYLPLLCNFACKDSIHRGLQINYLSICYLVTCVSYTQ